MLYFCFSHFPGKFLSSLNTGWIARWKGSGSTMSSIKQEIMTHMFSGPGGTQVRLSGDSGRFCMVMSAFNVYECSYKVVLYITAH